MTEQPPNYIEEPLDTLQTIFLLGLVSLYSLFTLWGKTAVSKTLIPYRFIDYIGLDQSVESYNW